jgi:hypothetical protein
MSEFEDPRFGKMKLRRGTWRCAISVPALGADIPLEFDGYDESPPTDDQRACLSDFLDRCDVEFVRKVEMEIFNCAQMIKREQDLFGRVKAALEKINVPGDIWQTMSDLSIMVFRNDEDAATLALRWAAQWDFDHGLQVLYEIGGRFKVTEIGDDYFD